MLAAAGETWDPSGDFETLGRVARAAPAPLLSVRPPIPDTPSLSARKPDLLPAVEPSAPAEAADAPTAGAADSNAPAPTEAGQADDELFGGSVSARPRAPSNAHLL